MPMLSQNTTKPRLVQRASQSPRTHFTAVPALCAMSTTLRGSVVGDNEMHRICSKCLDKKGKRKKGVLGGTYRHY